MFGSLNSCGINLLVKYNALSRWIFLCQSKLHFTTSSNLWLYSLIGKWPYFCFTHQTSWIFLWHLFSQRKQEGKKWDYYSWIWSEYFSTHVNFYQSPSWFQVMNLFLHAYACIFNALVTQPILNSIKFEWIGENFVLRILFSLYYILFCFVLFNNQFKAYKGWFAPELLCSQTLPSSPTTTKSSPSDPMTTSRANQVQYHPLIYTILSRVIAYKLEKKIMVG
jgi:hypothetical protein